MWSVGRTILTGENSFSGKETCPSATIFHQKSTFSFEAPFIYRFDCILTKIT